MTMGHGDGDGGDGQGDRLPAIMIEVTCPLHGRIVVEVSARTSAAGPPCPTCGSTCTTFAPMLALACACAAATPHLRLEGLLQALRQEGSASYTAATRPTPARAPFEGRAPSEPVSMTPTLAAPTPRD